MRALGQPALSRPAQGLYDPRFEHDACGVAFVATLTGVPSRTIVDQALTALRNLDHRGAAGAEINSGDGAGILFQVPDAFLREVVDFDLPPHHSYAVGTGFFAGDADDVTKSRQLLEEIAAEEGLQVLGWREVPVQAEVLGSTARSAMPTFVQVFVAGAGSRVSGMALERRAFCLRKRAEKEADVYFPSLSARTLVYKGMLTTDQLDHFFPDLADPRIASALAVVHSRFSTNTFPSWPLAHPFRYIAHNGEINTVMGNRNWMRAREALLDSDLIPGDLERLYPICTPGASDSASFDEVLELLHMGGRSLPHAVLMMIPEAWENHAEMDAKRRAFYEFHSTLMEPWDGPACVVFSDGSQIGAVLDRNGLRPSRYWVTDDGLVVLASEVGVLDIDQSRIVRKGRLQPGRMFLVDTDEHRIIEDEEVKSELAAEHPYDEWLHAGLVHLDDVPEREHIVHTHASVTRRQQIFGYTEEELRILLTPMANTGAEPIGSMGTDSPIAALSAKPRLIFDYFSQLFAQVTNPPLDAIREELVTSLLGQHRPRGQPARPDAGVVPPGRAAVPGLLQRRPGQDPPHQPRGRHARLRDAPVPGPVRRRGRRRGAGAADRRDLRRGVRGDRPRRPHHRALRPALHRREGADPVAAADRGRAPPPGPREDPHPGRAARRGRRRPRGAPRRPAHRVRRRRGQPVPRDGVGRGPRPRRLLRQGRARGRRQAPDQGARQGRAQGDVEDGRLHGRVLHRRADLRGGRPLDRRRRPLLHRHHLQARRHRPRRDRRRRSPAGTPWRTRAAASPPAHRELEIGGEYQWRREGEPHLFDPETVFRLQHATRAGRYDVFKQYTQRVDEQAERLMTLRGLFRFKDGQDGRAPIDIDEVEPVESIVKRFSTGAMSYGSISQEAHETLAIAMNRLGAKSNTGEGGEDADRLYDPERRSAIKQVASGRFGVTSEYLTNADDIQIKMAQGAKPGEGGQLPGHKVYPWIARTRYSTPGVGLISPPPHHDIYSIEDLKQLIHDLKNANPRARVHVKLVAEVGVGTVAAGVSKAHADVVLISGHDGGTGASPLTSLKHAGGPWELGLAETQQTLLLNGLRDRIVVQTDGQLKTGRDVVVAALLGAEEYGFATAPLVVSGCIMMRVCHLDTCPVGVATQNPVLRERFTGKPEFVVNFFEYIAEEVRELLAQLGFRTLEEAIGRADVLDVAPAVDHWKAAGLDLTPILHQPAYRDVFPDQDPRCTKAQDHGLERALDNELVALAGDALERGEPVRAALAVRNVNRTVGTILGHEVTKRYGGAGLPDDTIDLTLTGSAGQSFGAFVPRGITLRLEGDANDYLGKGLSGGRIIVRPDRAATFSAEEQIIAGNVIAYGATAGEIFIRGGVGERFCVRNSGVTAVVEGVGDHGCEYMTGGRAVVLGPTGRNFAAGMSGGYAFVLDLDEGRVNPELVELGAGGGRRRPTSCATSSGGTRRRPARWWPRRCWPSGRRRWPASPR